MTSQKKILDVSEKAKYDASQGREQNMKAKSTASVPL